jgi:hypothetical protein
MVTFQHFHGDPPTPPPWSEQGPMEFGGPDGIGTPKDAYPGCLPSTVAYCRWFWRTFEPERGRFDWSMVEGALKKAHARGQTLHVRLQSFGSRTQPQLPEWFMRSAPTQPNPGGYIDPVYDSPEYLECWRAALASFAERFDGRPGMDALDLAFVGPWGEGAGQEGLISRRRIEEFVDAYIELFRHTHLLVNCGYQLDCGTRRGLGWRADSFADVATDGRGAVPEGLGWNHMYDSLPKENVRAGEAWKKSPVSFEWGQSLEFLRENKHPVDFIVQQGLKYHMSFLMPRNLELPDGFLEPMTEFAKLMGYRFVLRQVRFERRARSGDLFTVEMWIENIGCAPIYHHYPLALRFSQGDKSEVVLLSVDPMKWLPGDAWVEEEVRLPGCFTKGEVEMAAALVDPVTKTPRVSFAVEGTDKDGWHPLDTVEVQA